MNTLTRINYTEMTPRVHNLLEFGKKSLTGKRFSHIQRVTETSILLAQSFSVDIELCVLSAVAHDLAREWQADDLIDFLEMKKIRISPDEYRKPILLHGPVAAVLIQEDFDVTENEVIEAVHHHTLGTPGLGPVGKILYLSDYLEPGRKYADKELLSEIVSLPNPDEALIKVYEHLCHRHKKIHPRTHAMIQEARYNLNLSH